MTNKEILQADLLDILFEHRNKAYGAYALRKNYNQRLQWALAISLSLAFVVLLIGVGKGSTNDKPPATPGVILHAIELPKQKPATTPSPQPKRVLKVAQIKDVPIKIVPNDQVKKPEVPTINDLENALISTVNKTGTGANGIPEASNPGTDDQNSKNTRGNREPEFHPTSSEAQFPGGVESFKKFLSKNLVTPDDLQVGEKKTVLVRFKVDVDGLISSAQIVQSGGEKYDREVLRVLNKMPKWVPATQNGVKVPTWFTQPVSFIGVE